jgi:hypothetical protein
MNTEPTTTLAAVARHDLFGSPVTVRSLLVGDTWGEWDIWNTADGLKRIPRDKVGTLIQFVQPRDIFLRPLSMTHGMTLVEWEKWIKRDHRLYD